MKKIRPKTKKFLINRQKKLMRQRMKQNKKKRRRVAGNQLISAMHVDTDSVNRILEKNGFGNSRGESILRNNGIEPRGKRQRIKEITIRVPEVLSISEDSDAVIDFLMECYGLIINNDISKVTFDHTNCRNLGLSASTFMDVVVITAEKVADERLLNRSEGKKREKLALDGITDSSSDISKILFASGLPKHIGANLLYGKEIEKNEITPLDVITGKSQAEERRSSSISTTLTTYFQKCLNREGMGLTSEGCGFFTDMFGEVLSNCDIHGGKGGTWYTQGIYLKKQYGGEMQLLFMNIGETIYDGLNKHSSSETRDRLKHFIKRHRSNMNSKWTREMIITLFALQDGISRYRKKNKEGFETRGNGTIIMIDAFQAIGAEIPGRMPKMTIVSGNTRIVFDEKYKLKEEKFNDEIFGKGTRKIIAFNEDNNIYEPADSNNVMKCKLKFPGTVISLKFILNREYIENKKRKAK